MGLGGYGRWTVPVIAILIAAVAVLTLRQGGVEREDAHVIWAVGDSANGSEQSRAVAELISADDPKRVLYLGDVYEAGTPAEFEANFRSVFGELVTLTSPTPGNHDWPMHAIGYDRFWAGARGEALPHWYAFELGGWEVISLNTEDYHAPGDPQLDWLKEQLTERGDCRIAFWHRPRYSGGIHGDDASVEPFWDLLEGRARLVLSGHEHNYQRFAPVGGVTQLIAGTGGEALYPVVEEREGLVASEDSSYGALRIELFPDRAEIAYVSTTGEVLDSFSTTCRPAG